jgi:PAS domain S-box-containing protein
LAAGETVLVDDEIADLAGASAAMLRALAQRWRRRLHAGRLRGHPAGEVAELVARLDGAAALVEHGSVHGERASSGVDGSGIDPGERFRLLLDGVQDYAILMLDPDGRVVSWNAGAERIKGYLAEEILGQHFSRFYPPEDAARGHSEEVLRLALRDGRYAEEAWRVRKDGTRFWASVVISAVRDEKGALRGFAKVTRDLTERKRAEDERLGLARAQEALRLRDEFLAVAAHELRTPLTALMLHLDSLAKAAHAAAGANAPDGPSLAAKADKARRHGGRISGLVEALLDLSNTATRAPQLAPAEIDLAAVARDVIDVLRPGADAAGCAVHLHAPSPVMGHWDRLRLEQVVANLLSNAVKFGRGHPVELTVAADGARARLTVRDRGVGIAAKDLVRIFDRFERGVSAQHYAGLGLGLYLTRLYVEAHGGTVRVRSAPGEGATFEVELPLLPAAAPAPRPNGGAPA